jgi:hypothetical protein
MEKLSTSESRLKDFQQASGKDQGISGIHSDFQIGFQRNFEKPGHCLHFFRPIGSVIQLFHHNKIIGGH